MEIDIKNMTATLYDCPGDRLQLIKPEINDRTRVTKSKKATGDQLDISNISESEYQKYEKRVS